MLHILYLLRLGITIRIGLLSYFRQTKQVLFREQKTRRKLYGWWQVWSLSQHPSYNNNNRGNEEKEEAQSITTASFYQTALPKKKFRRVLWIMEEIVQFFVVETNITSTNIIEGLMIMTPQQHNQILSTFWFHLFPFPLLICPVVGNWSCLQPSFLFLHIDINTHKPIYISINEIIL